MSGECSHPSWEEIVRSWSLTSGAGLPVGLLQVCAVIGHIRPLLTLPAPRSSEGNLKMVYIVYLI
jgi:hypothetical protein